MNTLVMLIYDGINNSVFEGQVLKPLLDQLQANHLLIAHLISFEYTALSPEKIESLKNTHPRLKLYIFTKTPIFLGNISILLESRALKNILRTLSDHTLIARGPLAGALAQRTLQPTCTALTLQARGLLAEEFLYTATHHKKYVSWIQKIRYKQLFALEKNVYNWQPTKRKMPLSYRVEMVTTALAQYLYTTYGLDPAIITHATLDLPNPISDKQKQIWRTEIRTQLQLATTTQVYVYNGSCKAWQCFEETIRYFKEQLTHHPDSFLLILTHDTIIGAKILEAAAISNTHYHITTIPHQQIYRYLCACDKGILLRKPHILNWISRPTKAIEYQAAGLKIIHNKTIEFLAHLPSNI